MPFVTEWLTDSPLYGLDLLPPHTVCPPSPLIQDWESMFTCTCNQSEGNENCASPSERQKSCKPCCLHFHVCVYSNFGICMCRRIFKLWKYCAVTPIKHTELNLIERRMSPVMLCSLTVILLFFKKNPQINVCVFFPVTHCSVVCRPISSLCLPQIAYSFWPQPQCQSSATS